MGRRIFQNLSFASRPQPPMAERSEPRLLPSEPPLAFRRPVPPDPTVLSAARDDATRPAIAPITAASDRNPIAPAVRDPSSSRVIAVAGCILFAVAGVGSAGFLLMANPGKEVAGVASPATPPAPLQTDQTAGPGPLGAAEQHPAETGAGASPPNAPPHPTVNDAALQSPSGLPLVSPAAPMNPPPTAAVGPAKPPSRTPPAAVAEGAGAVARVPSHHHTVRPSSHPVAMVAAQPQSAGNSAAAGAQTGDRHTVAATEATADRRAPSAPVETRSISRAVTAERHAHLRAAREIRTSRVQTAPGRFPPHAPERRTHVAGSGPAQRTDHAAQFNDLLAHLTGSPKPADRASGQSLTPPAAGAPDPFGPSPRGETPDQ
jgi:hypothetical protein